MSHNHAVVHDAAECVAAIVDCIRKMRAEGFADNEIAGLFRHAADKLREVSIGRS
jgi:hypothetical protein